MSLHTTITGKNVINTTKESILWLLLVFNKKRNSKSYTSFHSSATQYIDQPDNKQIIEKNPNKQIDPKKNPQNKPNYFKIIFIFYIISIFIFNFFGTGRNTFYS